MSTSFTPPPPLAVAGSGSFITQLPPPMADDTSSSYFSSASASSASPSSVMTVMIIIASAVIVSASIYLLLRVLSKRSSSVAADDVVLRRDEQKCHVVSKSLLESLPLFSFRSITGNLAGGDCAVCLSKFEPHDQLRLLPLCCHAFHVECIDTWIVSNQTCPLCRSTVFSSGTDALDKILSAVNGGTSDIDSSRNGNGGSFRIEIGSISRRRGVEVEEVEEARRRSYSVGSFEYIVDDNAYEVSVGCTTHHRRGISNFSSNEKDSSVGVPIPEQPGEVLAGEISGTKNWLRDYMDRLSSVSISSRATSFRSSGRFFTGSSRRSEAVVVPEDLEANRAGEEISELFRWLSGI